MCDDDLITLYLNKSTLELCKLQRRAEKLSDDALSDVLVRELCKQDGAFCSHCVGKDIASFRIDRDCQHRYFVTPVGVAGEDITEFVVDGEDSPAT
jgi:hypothetical protein